MCRCHHTSSTPAPVLSLDGAHPRDTEVADALTRPDPSSYANHDVAPVTHMHLSLSTDFAAETITGAAIGTLVAPAPVSAIVFDTRDLAISSVSLLPSSAAGANASAEARAAVGTPLEYWVSHEDGKLGQALVVKLPSPSASAVVKIEFATAKDASAIQWLSAEQTEGKKHPYLFTQCQAIHARSLFPCQDSPGIKFTYTADVTVPAPLQALMSAVLTTPTPATATTGAAEGSHTWSFTQKVPIPAYLVALCVGNLTKKDISDRCAVWAEPEKVDAAAYEFAETEKYLQAAENLCGPYVWGRYDLLLMPPSYPYGGMENACLTFVTPTLLAGDRSLANVVAHEIAHSWSGNLVTNKTWESFFLNEGFTVFIERKILEALYGEPFKGLHSLIGWEDLKGSISQFGADHPFTSLHVDIGNEDPDDAFSSVPYEKGCTLLTNLETLIGGAGLMNEFLKAYFNEYKYKSIDTNDFTSFFTKFCVNNGVSDTVLSSIDWKTLLHTPGMPSKPEFNTSLATEVAAIADQIVAGATVAERAGAGWTSTQATVYFDRLIDAHEEAYNATAPGSAERAEVDAKWAAIVKTCVAGVLASEEAVMRNPEHCFRYLTLQARAGSIAEDEHKSAVAARCDAFLASNGRMKFVRPLYRDLFMSTLTKEGEEIFGKYKKAYHNICSKMIERDLEQASPKWR